MYATSNHVTPSRNRSEYRSHDTMWPRQNTPLHDFHMRHVSDVPARTANRTSMGPSSIPQSMSSIPSKDSLNQKRPAGFRAVLKRMFSSKRHRSVPVHTSDYRYNDPGRLVPVLEQQPRTRLESSPPPDPVLPGTALTSHSTSSPSEMTDPNMLSLPRRRRRNTLPSIVFSDKDAILLPTATSSTAANPSEDKKWVKEDYVSDGQLKRRSRSADALRELLRSQGLEPPSTRDRAGEINYWRDSAIQNPVPVYSGQSILVDPVHVLGPVSSVEESDRDSSITNPMQAFDFGLDVSDRSKNDLIQRINTLEIKLFDFEYAIAKLQGNDIAKPKLNPTTFPRGSIHDVFPDNHAKTNLPSASSHGISYLYSPDTAHGLSFLSSPEESPTPSPLNDDLFCPQRASKETTSTIRLLTPRRRSPRRSIGTSSSSSRLGPTRFETLMDMIKDEQTARHQLEAQVMELQKEVEILRTPVYATIREIYPSTSPESTHHSPGTPRGKTLHRTQGFQLNHSPETSRFSATDPDSETEGFEDVYETPDENRSTLESARETLRLAVA